MKKLYQKPTVATYKVAMGAMMAGSDPSMSISSTPVDKTAGDSRDDSSSLWEDGSEEQQ